MDKRNSGNADDQQGTNDTKEREAEGIFVVHRRRLLTKPLRDMPMQLPDRGSDGVVFKYAGRGMADITQGIETGCA
jgi:hypothetical protein